MTPPQTNASAVEDAKLAPLLDKFDAAIDNLSAAADFAKPQHLGPLLDLARRLLLRDAFSALQERSARLESAGLFNGTDWASPATLQPALAAASLKSPDANWVVLETLNQLRMLDVAEDRRWHSGLSSEQARHYLNQVMALNLELLFDATSEAEREIQGRLAGIPRGLFQHIVTRLGFEQIADQLVEEIWRLLDQRPIQVDAVKQMITRMAVVRQDPTLGVTGGQGADRLITSLYSPTRGCHEDPGLAAYQQRLSSMDDTLLQQEAAGFARAMHDTGLVSPYHCLLIRHLVGDQVNLIGEALGLSSTGRDCLLCYTDLCQALIEHAVHPESAQALYGLALMLERGILYHPAVAPALWRQLSQPLSARSRERLVLAYGDTPRPENRLLGGVLLLLGLPFGIGQGNNPTCQAARALSMWAYSDPDYLLHLLAWAARDDEIIMHFEGQPISSAQAPAGLAPQMTLDVDPVSLLVVPHLDRIYAAMMQACIGREGDPHRWVNPEFHGWWTGRGFQINVDVSTGLLAEPEAFFRHFSACYHPLYNGNRPLVHPQPAGIAATDSTGRFIGWHAISILRVALDPRDVMRVYFFNPNNDSGQDWGQGVVVSTAGRGERYGEASLPFEDFAARLYIFHFDPLDKPPADTVEEALIERIMVGVRASWGADRLPSDPYQAASEQNPPT